MINPVSGGRSKIDREAAIRNYFQNKPHSIEFFVMSGKNDAASLEHWINKIQPHRVVAVGGDGTINLVARHLLGKDAALGIIPAGSANGLAKELKIPFNLDAALEIIQKGMMRKMDVVQVNDQHISLHLADIGLNAQLIKYFEESNWRGKLGYAKVLLKTLWRRQQMKVQIETDEENISREAFMVVLANSRTYGTGAVINPHGDLYDGIFEVVIIRRLALSELFKMIFFHKPFNPKKIELFRTTLAVVKSKRKAHFQVDGEYLGREQHIKAVILSGKLNIMLPSEPSI